MLRFRLRFKTPSPLAVTSAIPSEGSGIKHVGERLLSQLNTECKKVQNGLEIFTGSLVVSLFILNKLAAVSSENTVE